MENILYTVAGHTFRLSFQRNRPEADSMANYAPFRVEEIAGGTLFHLSVVADMPPEDAYEEAGRFDDDIASIVVLRSQEGGYRFRIAYPGSGDYCTMDTDALFSEARVWLPANSEFHFFCLNNSLMLLYTFSTAKSDTVLIHASVIKNAGEGFAFLGKSGTGKSTHSRLWADYIEGSELLNDDNPVVRLTEGRAMVYGSPWSGKTPCYRNQGVPLKGIVRLRQAPENRMTKLNMLQAYAAILPSCSCMKWETHIMDAIHNTVEKLAGGVPCYRLDCLPDADAAVLCSSTLKRHG